MLANWGFFQWFLTAADPPPGLVIGVAVALAVLAAALKGRQLLASRSVAASDADSARS